MYAIRSYYEEVRHQVPPVGEVQAEPVPARLVLGELVGSEFLVEPTRPRHRDPSPGYLSSPPQHRITSYNVCYTKLLRAVSSRYQVIAVGGKREAFSVHQCARGPVSTVISGYIEALVVIETTRS